MPYCTQCGRALPEGASYCPHCGQPTAGGPPTRPLLPTPGEAPSEGVAIIALLLNVLFLPGLGTLIAGRSEGWWQLGLFVLGLILAIVLIGIPILIAAWVWGIVSGVRALQDAQAAARARASQPGA